METVTGKRDIAILAIDPGSSCGFAISCGSEIHSGTWTLTPARGESPGMRYLKLRSELAVVLEEFSGLKLIVYEAAHHRGGAATEYGVGCSTHIQSFGAEHGIEVSAVHSATLKKWATGKGNTPKPQMTELGKMQFAGLTTKTDDEVDARWILAYAIEKYLPGLR